MRNAGETDEKFTILVASLPLLENEIVDPFTLLAYSFDFDKNSTAFIPNGKLDPVDATIANLREIGNHSPSLRPFIADTVRCVLAGVLLNYVNGGGNVGLSDDLLFSQKSQAQTGGSGSMDHEQLCSNPAAREKFHGQRLWFVSREVYRAKPGFHITGIWQKAAEFAGELDFFVAGTLAVDLLQPGPPLRGRRAVPVGAARVVVRTTTYNHFDFLNEEAKQLDRSDKRKVTNLAIAFGYLTEWLALNGGDAPTRETIEGGPFQSLGRQVIEMCPPKLADIALACGGLNRELFK